MREFFDFNNIAQRYWTIGKKFGAKDFKHFLKNQCFLAIFLIESTCDKKAENKSKIADDFDLKEDYIFHFRW